jgi:tripartite motif-containing protein 71
MKLANNKILLRTGMVLLPVFAIWEVVLVESPWAQQPTNVQLELSWGEFGNADAQFHEPKGIAVSPVGTVAVLDTQNDRVKFFTLQGVFLNSWGNFPPGARSFEGPLDLFFDSNGNVAISNDLENWINIFTPEGSYVRGFGTKGIGKSSLTVDGDGNYYLGEWDSDKYTQWFAQVEKFDPSGTSIMTFGKAQLGIYPPEGLAIRGSNEILVSDTGKDRVVVFDLDGNYIRELLSSGTTPGKVRSPHGLALDPAGNIYVADTGNQRIQMFNPDGSYRTSWGVFGVEAGQFRYPWDVAVDASGAVYVTDTFNHRIEKFRTDANPVVQRTVVRQATWGKIKALYGNGT